MTPATRATSSVRPDAYEIRKNAVDPAAAMQIFDRSFALNAFLLGYSAGQGRSRTDRLPDEIVGRIDSAGHRTLAGFCLAFFLAHENAHERPEDTAYLSCLRAIRDGAQKIARAADELADQIRQHGADTGELELVRTRTLHQLANALHGRFRSNVGDDWYQELIGIRLIDHRFSDLAMTHGLVDCAALYNEAEAIREQHVRNREKVRQPDSKPAGMRTGNKVDRQRRSFVRDLASVYEQTLEIPPTVYSTKPSQPGPFLRFVERVFTEFCDQTAAPVDPQAYLSPSWATVRNYLKARCAD